MNTINVGGFSFIGNNLRVQNPENMKTMRDIHPEINVRTDSVDISEEGRKALREKVRSMPGYFDWAEETKINEMISKSQIDPVYNHREAMNITITAGHERVKKEKGSYNIDDLMGIKMEAFGKQYYETAKAHDNNEKDIYYQDGMDENKKLRFHKIEKEEDLGYLQQAFMRNAEGLGILATIQEENWKVRSQFGGELPLSVKLPENYDKRIVEIMEKAGKEAENNYIAGKYNSSDEMAEDAKNISMKYLKEDSEFFNTMSVLFSKIKPMMN